MIQMVSYWKNTQIVYQDDNFMIMIGYYNHMDGSTLGDKSLGVYWDNGSIGFPNAHGILTPCVIPNTVAIAMLAGLLSNTVINNPSDSKQIQSLKDAIDFLR